jgi:hypothetical protein
MRATCQDNNRAKGIDQFSHILNVVDFPHIEMGENPSGPVSSSHSGQTCAQSWWEGRQQNGWVVQAGSGKVKVEPAPDVADRADLDRQNR